MTYPTQTTIRAVDSCDGPVKICTCNNSVTYSSADNAALIVRAVNEYDALCAVEDALKRHQQDGECYCVNIGEGNTSGNPCAHCLGRAALANLEAVRKGGSL